MGEKPKILIIRPSALGDTLMLLPALTQLGSNTEVIFAGKKPGLDFLKPYVNTCLDYERPGWHTLFMEGLAPGTTFPLPPVDHIVAFLNDRDGCVKENLKAFLPGTLIHIFPPFPPPEEKLHVAFYLAQCLQSSGLPVDAAKSIEEARQHPMFMDSFQRGRNGTIIFHPGSGGSKKNHSPDFWLELINGACKDPLFSNRPVILLLGPAEEPLFAFFREKLNPEKLEISISPDSESLLSLLNSSSLYFGHDSGITHLAAMHGIPTIALFKNSSVCQWSPLGPAVRVVEDKTSPSELIRETLREAENLTRLQNNLIA